MLSPSHPVRYFTSLNLRRLSRKISDVIQSTHFATGDLPSAKPKDFNHVIVSNRSPIFRNLLGVRRELQANKKHNLSLILPAFNSVVIAPGDTFSFWHLAGRPSANRGFKTGLVIQHGQPAEGLGGGLCQLSNSIFWCFLHSNILITERHRHSFDLFPDDGRSVPFGLGATVAYGAKDLRAKNVSALHYQLNAYLDADDLVVELKSKEPTPWKFSVTERESTFYRKEDGRIFRKNQVYRLDQNSGKEEFLFGNEFECRYNIDKMWS
jgi:vancomycin resistance protein VanW